MRHLAFPICTKDRISLIHVAQVIPLEPLDLRVCRDTLPGSPATLRPSSHSITRLPSPPRKSSPGLSQTSKQQGTGSRLSPIAWASLHISSLWSLRSVMYVFKPCFMIRERGLTSVLLGVYDYRILGRARDGCDEEASRTPQQY